MNIYLWVLHVGGLLLFFLNSITSYNNWEVLAFCGAMSLVALCLIVVLRISEGKSRP